MQDIKQIKKELSGFEEIELPYLLKKDQSYIKFITLKNDEEFFFDGGYFQKMGCDKMFLKKDKEYKEWYNKEKKKLNESLSILIFFGLKNSVIIFISIYFNKIFNCLKLSN